MNQAHGGKQPEGTEIACEMLGPNMIAIDSNSDGL